MINDVILDRRRSQHHNLLAAIRHHDPPIEGQHVAHFVEFCGLVCKARAQIPQRLLVGIALDRELRHLIPQFLFGAVKKGISLSLLHPHQYPNNRVTDKAPAAACAPSPSMRVHSHHHCSLLMFFHEPKLPYRSGCQRNTVKTHGLAVTHQNVHTLHCLTRRPFHQIINRRHHYHGIAPLWLRH